MRTLRLTEAEYVMLSKFIIRACAPPPFYMYRGERERLEPIKDKLKNAERTP